MNSTTVMEYVKQKEPAILERFRAALPKGLNSEKALSAFKSEIIRTSQLQKCSPESLIKSALQAAQLGLEVNGILGHAYIVPYKDSCQFILGYRGMIALARRSGQIISIYAQAVYKNDFFEFEFGINEKLRHKPTSGERGELIYVYAIAKLENTYSKAGKEGVQFDVMSRSEIDKIKSRSQSAKTNFSPWKTDYEEMAKKTVVRRLFKYLPISTEIQEQIMKEEIKDLNNKYEDIEDVETIETSKSEILANKIKFKEKNDISDFVDVDTVNLAKDFFGEEKETEKA